jgi:hypothetical protein
MKGEGERRRRGGCWKKRYNGRQLSALRQVAHPPTLLELSSAHGPQPLQQRSR